MRSLLRACALSCGAFLLAAGGEAEAEVNFKGRTIEVLLGSAPGGGTDGTTRLVGTFLEKYLPGNPTMRYRNVPGGHGAKALNYFTKVKPDGLTWAGGGSSHVDHSRKGRHRIQPTGSAIRRRTARRFDVFSCAPTTKPADHKSKP